MEVNRMSCLLAIILLGLILYCLPTEVFLIVGVLFIIWFARDKNKKPLPDEEIARRDKAWEDAIGVSEDLQNPPVSDKKSIEENAPSKYRDLFEDNDAETEDNVPPDLKITK